MTTAPGHAEPDRPEHGGEAGFTIVEVLVAGVILVLGSIAIFMTFAASIHNVQRSREAQIGASVAQREIERIRVIPYDSVALTTTPVVMTTQEKTEKAEKNEPRYRLRVTGTITEFDLARSSGKEEWRPVMAPGGLVTAASSGTTKVTASDGTEVEVERFVVCEEAGKTTTTCKAKRIVIDVLPIGKVNLGTYKHAYYELQSTLVDPTP